MSVREAWFALLQRKNDMNGRIAAAARPMVAVLKDAGRLESAKQLDELYFEADALDQEFMKFVKANLHELLETMFK